MSKNQQHSLTFTPIKTRSQRRKEAAERSTAPKRQLQLFDDNSIQQNTGENNGHHCTMQLSREEKLSIALQGPQMGKSDHSKGTNPECSYERLAPFEELSFSLQGTHSGWRCPAESHDFENASSQSSCNGPSSPISSDGVCYWFGLSENTPTNNRGGNTTHSYK